jgi:hypothetical protein
MSRERSVPEPATLEWGICHRAEEFPVVHLQLHQAGWREAGRVEHHLVSG